MEEKEERVEELGQEKPKKTAKDILLEIFYSFVWLSALVVILDQASKWGVYNAMGGKEGGVMTIIPGFLEFRLVFNSGMSYGFLSGSWIGWRIILAIVSWVASIAIVVYWLRKLRAKKDLLLNACLALILAGAVGNGIDRLFYWESTVGFSGVIDFIVIYFFGSNNNPPFGVFNIADASLSVGVVMLIIVYVVRMIRDARKPKEE